MSDLYLLSKEDREQMQRVLDWIKNFSGDGVVNRRTGATIKFPRQKRAGGASSGLQVKWCSVVSVAADYITCRGLEVDFNDATKDFTVAKPYDLQNTWLDGEQRPNEDGDLFSYSYDANNLQRRTVTKVSDSSTETQVITPSYIEAQTVSGVEYTGSRLLVCSGIVNGTLTEYTDEDNQTQVASWLDMNISGRAWAKED